VDTSTARRGGLVGIVVPALVVAAVLTALIGRAVAPPDAPVAPSAPVIAASTPPPSHFSSTSSSSGDGPTFWALDRRGDPLRWDACRPVRFVLGLGDAPEHAERDVRAALAVLGEASGLDLVLVGPTEERPHPDRPLVGLTADGWEWLPVLIAWAAPGEAGLPLTMADRGIALPVAVRDGDREALVTGQVVLNARRTDLVPGFTDRTDAIGATLLHEFAHVLGLGHSAAAGALMSEDPGTGPVVLGPGDLAGLRAVGAGGGCNPAPAPAAGRGLSATR
jgi:hypothetical protein